jgi:hypothetical protein
MLRRRLRQDITNWKVLGRLLPAIVVALLISWMLPASWSNAVGNTSPTIQPMVSRDFFKVSPEGIDPNYSNGRHNSWPWAMKWWPAHPGPGGTTVPAALFVGTNRDYRCFSFQDLAQAVAQAGVTLPINIFPYPPPQASQDLCTPSPADLSMQAEIWKWTPPASGTADPTAPNGGGNWIRVYQSPDTIPNPDFPGKFVPYEIGYRGMDTYVDTDGVQTLYVGGVTTQAMWKGKVPPPRVLYTKTGNPGDWTAVPQDPNTFLGDISKSSNRSIVSFNNQLFTINGSINGNGAIIASNNPSAGNDAWGQVTPPNTTYFEIYGWNGYLYAGTQEQTGFRVVKSRGTGSYPFGDWTTVLPSGGYATSFSKTVVSMHAYNGQLYVGTASPAEIYRINPDDTWDLVVGTPRQLPNGQWKYPLSGIDEGFNNQFNLHIYRMEDDNGTLYAGTYDSSTNWEGTSVWNSLRSVLGFDLFRTDLNGWYWTTITTNGFGSLNASLPGAPVTNDFFNYAARTFATTPFGLFLGASNDSYGLNLYLGNGTTTSPLPAPARLMGEMKGNQPVLSWDPVPGAAAYQILRAKLVSISLPPVVIFPPSTPVPAAAAQAQAQVQAARAVPTYPPNRIVVNSNPLAAPTATLSPQITNTFSPVWTPAPYESIATTSNTLYVDTAVGNDAPHGYLYVVLAVQLDSSGNVAGTSPASNVVLAPSVTPPTTLTSVNQMVGTWTSNNRNRFVNAAGQSLVLSGLSQAQKFIQAGQLVQAADAITAIHTPATQGTVVKEPETTDLEVMTQQLYRRIKLALAGVIDSSALL